MPMRASNKAIGAAVGSMILHSADARRIERRLNKIDAGKLTAAKEMHGLGHVSNKEMAKVLTGETRAGWTQHDVRKMVEFLQHPDVKIARTDKSASYMVSRAAKGAAEALEAAKPKGLTQAQFEARARQFSQERRKEANKEEEEKDKEEEAGSVSVLDRMRGAVGVANKVGGSAAEASPNAAVTTGSTIRDLRQAQRQAMLLKGKPTLPPPPTGSGMTPPSEGFQA